MQATRRCTRPVTRHRQIEGEIDQLSTFASFLRRRDVHDGTTGPCILLKHRGQGCFQGQSIVTLRKDRLRLELIHRRTKLESVAGNEQF